MARFQLLPAETRFYDWFEKASANFVQAATLLRDLLENYQNPEVKLANITDVERQGDFIDREIQELLRKTLITPLDQEDTNELSQSVEDVVDTIEQIANLLQLYKVETPTEESRQLAAHLVLCAEQIHLAMPLLRDKKSWDTLQQHILNVHRLEKEADIIGRRALDNLVKNSRDDWFEFMRWKEIYALLEHAVNRCEDVADVLQTVVVKNG